MNGGIIKIGVVGAESTGKTWLCERLAAHYDAVWVPEYAREYFNDSDIYDYTAEDLVVIAKKQLELEASALGVTAGILFCDTTLITLKIWAELEFAACPPEILEGLKTSRYDLFLVTANDVVWESDPLRQNKHSRELLLERNLNEIRLTGTPYALIGGLGEERLRRAIAAINKQFS